MSAPKAMLSLGAFNALGAREKRLVVLTALVLGGALVYLLAFEPAWKGREKLTKELPRLRQEVAQVDALAAELKRVSAASGSVGAIRGLRDEVDKSLAKAGIKGATTTGGDEGVDIRASGIAFEQLMQWQQVAQRELRLRIARLTVVRDSKAGLVSAQVFVEPAKK